MNKLTSSLQFVKTHSSDFRSGSGESYWAPNTDVYVCETGLVIKVELAGMSRDDLELTVEGSRVRIRGQRPDGCRSGKCRFLVMQIDYGAFETVIELPAGYDLGQAKACYQNGFLRIDVPGPGGGGEGAGTIPVV